MLYSGYTGRKMIKAMKWLVTMAVLLHTFSIVCRGQEGEWFELDRIRGRTIYRMLEPVGSYVTMETRYTELLQTAEKTSNDTLQAACLFQLAHINYKEAHYSHSLAWAKRGMDIARQLDDCEMLAVGYELLGRLHYLYSPEQAQYYYRNCWQQCMISGNRDLAIVCLNGYTLISTDYNASLEDLLSINLDSLSGLPKARLSHLIARSLTDVGRIDDALDYLGNTWEYLKEYKETSPLNILYVQQMARIMLRKGDTQKAWEYINKGCEIAHRNKLLLKQAENYKLASEIAQAEKQETLALEYYKKSVHLRDSVLNTASNRHFPNELLDTLIGFLAEEDYVKGKGQHVTFYIVLILVFISVSILIYSYKLNTYRKKMNLAVTGIKEQVEGECRARLKNHLMKILYQYKMGTEFCVKQTLEARLQFDKTNEGAYLDILESHSRKADELVNMLLSWVEVTPDMQPQYTHFDVRHLIGQMIDLYQIIYAAKQLSYVQSPENEPLIIYGDKIMIAIAIENLFFRITRNAASNVTIHISVIRNENGQFIFSLSNTSDKQYTYGKEIFARHIENLEKGGKEIHTADWDFNIFAVCLLKNRAKAWFKFDIDTGTACGFTMSAD